MQDYNTIGSIMLDPTGGNTSTVLKNITDVIIATIVYLSAFSLVIKMLISGRRKRKGKHTIPVAAPDGGGNPPSTSEAEKGGEGA